MKNLVFILIQILALASFAQPEAERNQNISRLVKALDQGGGLMLSCERTLNHEKTKFQFYSFQQRLISTLTVSSYRTSWSAQIDLLGLKLSDQQDKKTHFKILIVQKGEQKSETLHLQMDLEESAIRKSKTKIYAYDKNDIEHPFICRIREN